MVLIWQQGHGSNAIWGIPAAGSITMWVPVMRLAFLFGLSMDYEVFILARMREEYDATAPPVPRSSGHRRTRPAGHQRGADPGAVVLAMSTGPQTDIKILATGLGAGILVDATIVRCRWCRRWSASSASTNWWLPAWAARICGWPRHPSSRRRGRRPGSAGV